MKQIWDRIGLFEACEQRILDQTKLIWENGWLTDVEIEEIRGEYTDGREHESAEVEQEEEV